MSQRWYVVQTLSGQERKVKTSLENRAQAEELGEQISEVVLPTESVSEVRGGKKKITTRLYYPGYLLLHMDMNEKTWHFVRGTSGVLKFLGDKEPTPMPEEEVEEILAALQEKKEKIKPKVLFEVGETVKVTEGPFVNFSGVIDEVNPEKGKLKVMVSIFGRSTPVELEYWQVERT
ncbi:transcription termination/antitermination factor NusG [bacterium]|nr:transcription termination/antitermination factor NusG [bacterium]